jgi:hypothetical protein
MKQNSPPSLLQFWSPRDRRANAAKWVSPYPVPLVQLIQDSTDKAALYGE